MAWPGVSLRSYRRVRTGDLVSTPDIVCPRVIRHTMHRISLAVICGNEESTASRWADSWLPLCDELVLVRAVGALTPDRTVDIIREACRARGTRFLFGEYGNGPGGETWPHVDHFGAARQCATDAATCEWVAWCDLDDLLSPGGAEAIRAHVQTTSADILRGWYTLPSHDRRFHRERLWRRGVLSWQLPVHERLAVVAPNARPPIESLPDSVEWVHLPLGETRERSRDRNLRIYARERERVAAEVRERQAYLAQVAYYEAQDLVYSGRSAESVAHWQTASAATNPDALQRYEAALQLLQRATTLSEVRERTTAAIAILPRRREAPGICAEMTLNLRAPHEARTWLDLARALPPETQPIPHVRPEWQGWRLDWMDARIARVQGRWIDATEADGRGLDGTAGRRVSVLHATRRAREAIACEQRWRSTCAANEAVEWIYAVSADDRESLEVMQRLGLRHVIADSSGPVAAWNAAAQSASGDVLIAMSDDWWPIVHWDSVLLDRIGDTSRPAVLAVSDGIRQDRLLCLPILTAARLEQQDGELFGPYWSVYSDDEFAWRAYRDGVVVDARDVVIPHRPVNDATRAASNEGRHYTDGLRTFCERNPEASVSRSTWDGSSCWIGRALGLDNTASST